MREKLVWSFRWTQGSVEFVVPEPCTGFQVGETGDLIIPDCSGSIVFDIGKNNVSAICDSSLRINDNKGKVLIDSSKKYIIYSAGGQQQFTFVMSAQSINPAPIYVSA